MKSRSTHAHPMDADRSTDLFRIAFHNSPAMQTLTRTTDRVLVEVNDAFLETLGFSREEVIGKAALELNLWVHPEKAGPFRDQLVAAGRVRGYEVEIRTKAGEVRTVLLSADLVDIEGVAHVVAAGVDITERKAAEALLRQKEQRLRESEARFSTAFHANPAMVALTRLETGRLVTVNESFLRLTGYTENEVLGRTTLELGLYARPEVRTEFFKHIEAHGFVRDYEHLLRRKDGELRTLLISAEIVEVDRAPHLLVVGLDITARTNAEAKLRESERMLRETESRLSTAFRASPVVMTIARLTDGKFVEVNPAFTQLLKVEREQIIGRNSLDLDIWVDREERTKFFDRLNRDRVVRNAELQVRSSDRLIHTVQVSAEIIEIDREPHVITFGLDITQRRQADEELQLTLQRERELSQLRTDFVALVSHEFRTPLEIIMSSVDNLDRYHDRLPPEQRRELLRTINKSVRRMAGMMEDVLLLGRLDAGGTEFKPAPLDLAAICQRVCDEMESATNRRCPIGLTVDPSAVPAGAFGDEAALRHILTNLLSNAVKYSEPAQPVTLAVKRAEQDAIFQIADRGCGIPVADQPRLFQAFQRGGNVRQIHGTGLGLLIVRRCVELHGGEIAFESSEGRGTTFTVRLPLFREKKPAVS